MGLRHSHATVHVLLYVQRWRATSFGRHRETNRKFSPVLGEVLVDLKLIGATQNRIILTIAKSNNHHEHLTRGRQSYLLIVSCGRGPDRGHLMRHGCQFQVVLTRSTILRQMFMYSKSWSWVMAARLSKLRIAEVLVHWGRIL